MTNTYIHHRIAAAPRQWQSLAEQLAAQAPRLTTAGGSLFGLWRSQIGRPRDEITAITVWQNPIAAASAQALLTRDIADIEDIASESLAPTLRPLDSSPPIRQGNYAFRWFVTPDSEWPEFLDLCAQAWPGFEAAYDSQVIGLWRSTGDTAGAAIGAFGERAEPGEIRSLLLTRRPDLAMWERSKLPRGEAETAVRDTLSRRYDLCRWTVVHTTTLLTAADTADKARWA